MDTHAGSDEWPRGLERQRNGCVRHIGTGFRFDPQLESSNERATRQATENKQVLRSWR